MSKTSTKLEDLIEINPVTKNQVKAFDSWNEGENLVLAGSAGTGKTFIAMYLALRSSLEQSTPYYKVIVVRSIVATRDMGYLPGTKEEKVEPFEAPYKSICYTPRYHNQIILNKYFYMEPQKVQLFLL